MLPYTLLVRWVWRFFFAFGGLDERTVKRPGVSSVIEDEEESVQLLLSLVPEDPSPSFITPDSFDARSAQSRLTLLGMASLRPRRLDGSGSAPVDLPGSGSAAAEVRAFIGAHGIDHPVLRSHAIPPDVANDVLAGQADRAIAHRDDYLIDLVNSLGERLAGSGRNDRPSLEYLLAKVGAD